MTMPAGNGHEHKSSPGGGALSCTEHTVTGEVEKVLYANEDSTFLIVRILDSDGNTVTDSTFP